MCICGGQMCICVPSMKFLCLTMCQGRRAQTPMPMLTLMQDDAKNLNTFYNLSAEIYQTHTEHNLIQSVNI